jgi:hypothetical protein
VTTWRDPIAVRKATLASPLSRAAPGLRFNEHMDEKYGPMVFAHACKLGLEGIVSKAPQLPLSLRALAGLDQEREPESSPQGSHPCDGEMTPRFSRAVCDYSYSDREGTGSNAQRN